MISRRMPIVVALALTLVVGTVALWRSARTPHVAQTIEDAVARTSHAPRASKRLDSARTDNPVAHDSPPVVMFACPSLCAHMHVTGVVWHGPPSSIDDGARPIARSRAPPREASSVL